MLSTAWQTSSRSRADDLVPSDAIWITPVRVVSASGPGFGTTGLRDAGFDSQYGAARAIDESPSTFCCLLDDTPAAAESNPQAIPAGGCAPVTGHIRFDLGRAMQIVGVRLISRQDGGVYAPKGIDLACLAEDDVASTFHSTVAESCSAIDLPERAFRLYEVQIDGSGLRQLTLDPPDEAARLVAYGLDPTHNELGPWRSHTDDFHPCYLPDGGVLFSSSRCERGVLCDAEDN